MKVLVDTCIWSYALRSKNEEIVARLTELINDSRVVVIGAIRQEILSGIKSKKQFKQIKQNLSAFDDIALKQMDYELAAEVFNNLRTKGIQGANTDFLICAVAINHNLKIYTNDQDFENFAQHLDIKLL